MNRAAPAFPSPRPMSGDISIEAEDKARELMSGSKAMSYRRFVGSYGVGLDFNHDALVTRILAIPPEPEGKAPIDEILRRLRLPVLAKSKDWPPLIHMERVSIRLHWSASGSQIVWGGPGGTFALNSNALDPRNADDLRLYDHKVIKAKVKYAHWLLLPPGKGKVSIELGGVEKDITDMSTAREYFATSLFFKPVHWTIGLNETDQAPEIRFQYVWASCK